MSKSCVVQLLREPGSDTGGFDACPRPSGVGWQIHITLNQVDKELKGGVETWTTLYYKINAPYVLATSSTDWPVDTPDKFRLALRLRPLSLRAAHTIFTSSIPVISYPQTLSSHQQCFWGTVKCINHHAVVACGCPSVFWDTADAVTVGGA